MFLEEAYCLLESAQDTPLCLGAPCSACSQLACVQCSLFYTRRFCFPCVRRGLKVAAAGVAGEAGDGSPTAVAEREAALQLAADVAQLPRQALKDFVAWLRKVEAAVHKPVAS